MVRSQRQSTATGIGNEDWITVQGGDGFYARIDPTDANIIYAESQDGNLSRRDLRTSESKSIRPQEDNDTAPRYRFQWNSSADDFVRTIPRRCTTAAIISSNRPIAATPGYAWART